MKTRFRAFVFALYLCQSALSQEYKLSGDLRVHDPVRSGRDPFNGPYLNKLGESWVENKYTLFLEGDQEEPGRGHNAFYTEGDTTFNVYHAYTRSQDGKPMLNIQPVYEAEDGWPTMERTSKLFRREE